MEMCSKASLFIKISKRNANSMEGEVKEEPERVIGAFVHQTTCLRGTLKRPILGLVIRGGLQLSESSEEVMGTWYLWLECLEKRQKRIKKRKKGL